MASICFHGHRIFAVLCSFLFLTLLFSHCGASPVSKPTTANTAQCAPGFTSSQSAAHWHEHTDCLMECKQSAEAKHAASIECDSPLRSIADVPVDLLDFLDCNRACTSNADLSIEELLAMEPLDVDIHPDDPQQQRNPVKLSPRGDADKGRYIPSLVRMCEAAGLRDCLTPLPPSSEKHRRDYVLNEITKNQSGYIERLKLVRIAEQNLANESSADVVILAPEMSPGILTTTSPTPETTDVDAVGKKRGR